MVLTMLIQSHVHVTAYPLSVNVNIIMAKMKWFLKQNSVATMYMYTIFHKKVPTLNTVDMIVKILVLLLSFGFLFVMKHTLYVNHNYVIKLSL